MALRAITWDVQISCISKMWDYLDDHWDENCAGRENIVYIWAIQELTLHHHSIHMQVHNGQTDHYTRIYNGQRPTELATAVSMGKYYNVYNVEKSSYRSAADLSATENMFSTASCSSIC